MKQLLLYSNYKNNADLLKNDEISLNNDIYLIPLTYTLSIAPLLKDYINVWDISQSESSKNLAENIHYLCYDNPAIGLNLDYYNDPSFKIYKVILNYIKMK